MMSYSLWQRGAKSDVSSDVKSDFEKQPGREDQAALLHDRP